MNGKAFVQTSVAGIIPVDENGKALHSGVRTQYIVYVETKTGQPLPQWEGAWIENKQYGISPVEIREGKTLIGKTKKEGKKVIVKAAKGNRLWQLMLTEKEPATVPREVQSKLKNTKVVLSGRQNGKLFFYTITTATELESPEYP